MDIQNSRYYMDETSAPFKKEENPFIRTKEDDEFDQMIIKKYNLVTQSDTLAMSREDRDNFKP